MMRRVQSAALGAGETGKWSTPYPGRGWVPKSLDVSRRNQVTLGAIPALDFRVVLSPNILGALFMTIAMAGFTIHGTFVTSVAGEMNAALSERAA
jgi:hypothetical protein